MVLGLNTVCDVYFAGSIDLLVDAWGLTPDATWMAAGGSAPEFFTSVIGATIAPWRSDEEPGAVLLKISLGCPCWSILHLPEDLWPSGHLLQSSHVELTKAQNDIGFGTIVGSAVFNVLFVIGLCGYVAKGNIDLTWWPLFRDCSYYITSLAVLAAFVSDQVVKSWEAAVLFAMYICYVCFMFVNRPLNIWAWLGSIARRNVQQVARLSPRTRPPKPRLKMDNFMEPDKVIVKSTPDEDEEDHEPEDLAAGKLADKIPGKDGARGDARRTSSQPVPLQEDSKGASMEDVEDDDDEAADGCIAEGLLVGDLMGPAEDDDEPDDFMERPDTWVSLIIWVLCLPVYIPLYYTLPWPSKGSKFYMVSFGLSLLWIGGFAFCLVWWTEIVPKLQLKNVGLPIPWLIKNAIESANDDWKGVSILSPYLMFYTCLLLGMVFGTVVSIMLTDWKLSKFLGGCMAVLYLLFIVACVLIEELQPDALRTN
eukprot:Skav210920  [mRNA]  locus=scaffold4127:68207:73315:- [translate_table: standard]